MRTWVQLAVGGHVTPSVPAAVAAIVATFVGAAWRARKRRRP